jgi:hypothetical protein
MDINFIHHIGWVSCLNTSMFELSRAYKEREEQRGYSELRKFACKKYGFKAVKTA